MQNLTVLGSTGSIGTSTLDVVARHPDKFRIIALTANYQADLLFRQCLQFRPRYVVLLDEAAVAGLRECIKTAGLGVEVLSGATALEQVSILPEVDTVMAAIVGAAGLRPTLAAARAGKKILLANKETLVMAGNVFMEAVRASGSVLLPIDSEHNAIFQALPRGYDGDLAGNGVRRILLTASGGPFLDMPLSGLHSVTPEQVAWGKRELRKLAAAAGRDPASISISAFVQKADAALARRFPDLELVDEQPAWNNRIVLRGLDALPLQYSTGAVSSG